MGKNQTDNFATKILRRKRASIRAFRQNAGGYMPRNCPLCGYYGSFTPFGFPPRIDAMCAKCGSLERHRMYSLLLEQNPLISKNHKTIHFAPENGLRDLIGGLSGEYVTADLRGKNVNLKLNIENLELEGECFDRIVCNQVMEHVDDVKMLSELHRILRPRGIAFLNTLVCEGWEKTYENPKVQTPRERTLHFAQSDHVRFYGRDIRDRLAAPGFQVEEFVAEEPDVSKYGLWRGERIFICHKKN